MDAPREIDSEALADLQDELRGSLQRFRSDPSDENLHALIAAALKDFSISSQPDELHDDTNFIQDLGLDSLAITEFVFFFEDAFDLKITNEQLAELRTIGALKRFLKAQLA